MSAICIGRRGVWATSGVTDSASASGVASASRDERNRMRGPSTDCRIMPRGGFRLTPWRPAERIRASMNAGKRLGILVGGGPAPGINTVISSAAIEAINEGFEVIGIRDGFKNLVRRDPSQ